MTSESPPGQVGAIVARATLVCGFAGFVIGLVRGLTVYAPTAWAAAFEVAIPAAAVGVVIGLGIIGVRVATRKL